MNSHLLLNTPVTPTNDDYDEESDYNYYNHNNTHYRERKNAISIADNEIDISNRQLLLRAQSLEPQNQGNQGTCFAHATARVITNLITKLIPNEFILNAQELQFLNNKTSDKIKNCFINNSEDYHLIRETLTHVSNICPLQKRYNLLILYYYTYLTIIKRHGCDGGTSANIIEEFVDEDKAYDFYYLQETVSETIDYFQTSDKQGYLISKSVDDICRELLKTYYSKLFEIENGETRQYELSSVKEEIHVNDSETYTHNWVTDFPEGPKNALRQGLYVLFSFPLDEYQWNDITSANINKFTIIPPHDCNGEFQSHTVVITNWEEGENGQPSYVTILNSWGTNWSKGGKIRLPSTLYNKFLLNPNCDTRYSRMKFTYFTLKDQYGNDYNFNNQPTLPSAVFSPKKHWTQRIIHKMIPTFLRKKPKGGKTKKLRRKHKSVKRKHKQRYINFT